MAAVLLLLSPEKVRRVSYVIVPVLLPVSGVYYDAEVLPDCMQTVARFSPVTCALTEAGAALLDGTGAPALWGDIWRLIIMGAVFAPLGFWTSHLSERYVEKFGKLERSG